LNNAIIDIGNSQLFGYTLATKAGGALKILNCVSTSLSQHDNPVCSTKKFTKHAFSPI